MCGGQPRASSPSGDSTFTTSAPSCARIMAATGPAMLDENSTTRTPSSGRNCVMRNTPSSVFDPMVDVDQAFAEVLSAVEARDRVGRTLEAVENLLTVAQSARAHPAGQTIDRFLPAVIVIE